MAEEITGKAKGKFDELDGRRSAVMDRSVRCAELTIPYIFREDTATDSDDLSRERVQGFGAKLVNHLVGKFVLSILPPSQPFYRLAPTEEALEAVTGEDTEARSQIDKLLAQKEDAIMRYINKSRIRKTLYPAIRLAMVTGDALIEKLGEGDGYKVYNMNQYVIERDASGNIQELVIKEMINYDSLPEEIASSVQEGEDEDLELYTRVWLDDGKYFSKQEIGEDEVSGTEAEFEKLSERFIVLRWNNVDNEDYGRGFVEEHLGSLEELNNYMDIIAEGTAIASKKVYLVSPNGMTKYKDFVEAENGDAIVGEEQDVGSVQADKGVDLQTAYNMVQDLKRELSEAFLMSSASIRDAERVTAYEVQQVASELEAAFGGIYTAIAEDIQMPIVEDGIKNIKLEGDEDVEVFITTGVEALGRSVELQKINIMMQELGNLAGLVGAEQVAQSVNVSSIASSIVANSGVAGRNFIYTESEKNQNVANSKREEVARMALESGVPQATDKMINQGE